MAENTYTGEVVRLAFLAGNEGAVRDAEFIDCQINGPAVIVARDGSEFTNCGWDGDANGVLWEIAPDRERVVGAVLIERCRFIGCRFSNIGIAGNAAMLAEWRKGLTT